MFLLVSRVALNVPAEIGANSGPLQGGADAILGIKADPHLFPATWARWNAGFYLNIATIVLVLFPSFIVFGILLNRLPRFKWVVWAGALGLQLFMTGWFAAGRWVA